MADIQTMTPTSRYLIRKFTEADWDAVWAIIRDVCQEGETFTFPRILSVEMARSLWLMTAPARTFVAVDRNGELVGTAKAGPNALGPGAHIGTASFMIAREARGRGAGRELAQHVISWARSQGFAALQFNAVVETNRMAVGLWKSCGFSVIGRSPKAFRLPDGSMSDLLMMRRSLSDLPEAHVLPGGKRRADCFDRM